ncbi:MAG: hypothetical protein CL940_02025, partial [Deltaproteobacteria bacterium]|nr:hypothetical protein [Deltaproteobacteria bacterium]
EPGLSCLEDLCVPQESADISDGTSGEDTDDLPDVQGAPETTTGPDVQATPDATTDAGAQDALDTTQDGVLDAGSDGASDGGSDSGSGDATDTGVEPPECQPEDAESQPCGFNGAGTQERTCSEGTWTPWGDCEDPDSCLNEDIQTGESVCGLNAKGLIVQLCESGQWTDTDTCLDPDACTNEDTQPSALPCGLNGQGFMEQLCADGQWTDTDTCLDPDVCINESIGPGETACGFNGQGVLEQLCLSGQWTDTETCLDPDVCTNEDTQPGETTCGQNEQGLLVQLCTNGQWSDSDTCDGIPVVSISALTSIAYEGGAVSAVLRVSLDVPGADDIEVSFSLEGSAEHGADYELSADGASLTGSVTLPAGAVDLDLLVTPLVTPEMERTEHMTLSLESATSATLNTEALEASITLVEHGPSPGVIYHVAVDGDDGALGTKEAPFASLAHGVSVLEPGDTLFIHDGTYLNDGFSEDHGEDGTQNNDNGVILKVGLSGSADAWTRIAAFPDGNGERPLLRFDGAGGIQLLSGASHVIIEGLEIEGPNKVLQHEWAHAHRWSKEALYTGRGIFTWGPVHHVVIRDCDVHHTPNSGIRFNKADYILVEHNTVSNATWWSSSAESGIVIATAEHIDTLDVVKILYSGNRVYNNWNFMEFCSGPLEGSAEDVYGNCDAYTGGIIDGQGLYVTRNYDTYLHGRMRFENNVAFNNGFGGVVYHKTDRGELVNNLVFMNGSYPGTSNYTGLTLNTADDVIIANNIVWAREPGDYAVKNNGNATNVVATHNYIVGKTQFGDPDENTFVDSLDAPPFDDFFTDVTGIADITPDPDALTGPSSAAEIDDVISALPLDFRPLPTTAQVIDQGSASYAPPVDRHGDPRPLGAGVDIGADEVPGDQSCSEQSLTEGASCDDGLMSTLNDTCHLSGACVGEPYSCYTGLCEASVTHNGASCDVTFEPPGAMCDDGDPETEGDVCDGTGGCSGEVPYDVLVYAHFQDQELGTYSKDMIIEDFQNAAPWANGLDEGRATVAEEDGERFLRVSYPEGGVGSALGGCQFKVPLGDAYEELYVSYWVRFGQGLDFVKGGKMPGLCGGDCNTGGNVPDGTDGFSARLMWRPDGKVTQYMYMPDQVSQWGDSLYWDEGGQKVFVPGEWHQVQTRLVMNTPGVHDGVLQSWFDGQLALDRDDIRYRDTTDLQLDTLYFSTFFGGSGEDWAPTADEVVDFDELVISTGPISFDAP